MPAPITLRWEGGDIEIEHDKVNGHGAVIHARGYELDEDERGNISRAGLSDSVSFIMSDDEARALFIWLGKYLHGA